MAGNFSEAVKFIASAIEDNSKYEAAGRLTDLNLPGFWVTPVSREFITLGEETARLTMEVFAIPDQNSDALDMADALSEMHDSLRVLAEAVPVLTGLFESGEIVMLDLSSRFQIDAAAAMKFTITVEDE